MDNEDKWMDEMGFVAQIDICWLIHVQICYLQVQLLIWFGKTSVVLLLWIMHGQERGLHWLTVETHKSNPAPLWVL